MKIENDKVVDCDPLEAPWTFYSSWIEMFRVDPEKMHYVVDAVIKARFGEQLSGEDPFLDVIATQYADSIKKNQIKWLNTAKNKSEAAKRREEEKRRNAQKNQNVSPTDHTVVDGEHPVPHKGKGIGEGIGIGKGEGIGKGIYSNEYIYKEGDKKNEKPKVSRFTPPTREELLSYVNEKGLSIDPDRFLDYYESNGWMVGKNKMKDWKAAVRNWARD